MDFSRRTPRAPRPGYRLDALRRRLRRNAARTGPCNGPRVQAYRARATEQRNSAPALDHSAVASLQRQIEHLRRE